MSEYSRERAGVLDAFVKYRTASNRWNPVSASNLLYFDRYCTKEFPGVQGITQPMLEGWCTQRKTENKRSLISRCSPVIQLVKYLMARGDENIHLPDMPPNPKKNYIPHAFSDEELAAFFTECDRRVGVAASREKAFRALLVAVMFRLLCSSGMRITEARLLQTPDVDFENGIINVRETKGGIQHYVALHDDTVKMLRSYDEAARRIYPGRKVFFPGKGLKPLSPDMLDYEFHKIWDGISKTPAVPYDFRHNYATTNINSWIDSGFEFHDKFVYLSKSMGHTSLESTKYYYSLVPALADILDRKSGAGFDEVVPEVIPYE